MRLPLWIARRNKRFKSTPSKTRGFLAMGRSIHIETLEERLTPALYDLMINPAQSTLNYSQIGFIVPVAPQSAGSHSAQLSGQLSVNFDATSITFLSPSVVSAVDSPGPFRPGMVPADLSSTFSLGGVIQDIRQNDVIIDIFGVSPVVQASRFTGASLELSTTLTSQIRPPLVSPPIIDTVAFAGKSDVLEATLVGDQLILRIPFELRQTSDVLGLSITNIYQGVIVATGRESGPIGSDLSISLASTPAAAAPGETISLGWSVTNAGNALAARLLTPDFIQ